MIVFLATVATLLLFVGFARDFLRLRGMPRLLAPGPVEGILPMVSVLIPARNEARNIARCLDGLLMQTYPRYEVIVVDDASTDATPDILAHYVQQHARIKVLHGDALPPEWTGKTYACQQAATAASGDWLLFLDADTVPQSTLIAALVTHTHRYSLDMLTVFPFLELRSFWERVILPPFQAIIYATFPFERLNAPDVRPDEVVANGQCIMVRHESYTAIGGHSAVRGAVLEDVLLARMLRAAGCRTGAVEGVHHVRVRMYTSGPEVVEGLTKNAIAGYRSGGEHSAWAGTRQFLLILAPMWLTTGGVALMVGSGDVSAWVVTGQALIVWLVALSCWSIRLRQLYELPWVYALLWPFGMISYGLIVLRALWCVRSGRGVIWKGRTYVGT